MKLRPFKEEDLPLLAAIRNNPDLQEKMMMTPGHLTTCEVREWIHRRKTDPKGEFLIVANEDDNAIGYVQLYNRELESAEIGICIAPEFQGRGFGSMAIDLLHQHAAGIGLKRLTLRVSFNNDTAIFIYKKAGYKPFGFLLETHL
jgi:RimJ/RimL family protein N-acetyltransferase